MQKLILVLAAMISTTVFKTQTKENLVTTTQATVLTGKVKSQYNDNHRLPALTGDRDNLAQADFGSDGSGR